MTSGDELLEESAEDLFEDAPCGYLSSRLDGTIVKVNRTFERWTGRSREELVGRRFHELLTPGGRIYHETHYAPLLRMQGSVREIALEIVRADGTRLPTLITAEVRNDAGGAPRFVRTTVFDASDRRAYEQELVRARDREREIALELQRSLLAGVLPSGGVEVGVTYRPAERGLEVGGDWYDAFRLEDESQVALVVGDVVGRGLTAAATMGQLRSACRALAAAGGGPADVLDGLDGYARRHGVGRMATVACAELDVGTGELRYACAGHPPPAVVEPGARARFLPDGRSLPLDAHGSRPQRAEGRATLAPGGAVVLYTDGLIERRDRPLPVGLDLLLATLDRLSGDAQALADGVVAELTPRGARTDDVCVLAARRPGGRV